MTKPEPETISRRHDLDALRALAPKELRYLGLIGSRAKVARIYEALEADGITPEQLRKVHAPVGLDLGAVTPQEIAVSILAEMIGVKYGKVHASGTSTTEGSAQSLRWTPGNAAKATVGG